MASGGVLRSFGRWDLVLKDLASGEQVYVNRETHDVQEDPPAEVSKILEAENRRPVYDPTPHRFVRLRAWDRLQEPEASESCVACNGLGVVVHYGECPLCDGLGFLPAEPVSPCASPGPDWYRELCGAQAPLYPPLRIVLRERILGSDCDDAAFVLRNLLSPAECEEIIAQAESFGLRDTLYNPRIRKNDRVSVMGEHVADALFERARPFLADVLVRTGPMPTPRGVPPDASKGRWTPHGLNPCFRVCKYAPGGFFLPHHDGGFTSASGQRSLKTFMIYLNDGFEGGETTFFKESQSHYRGPDVEKILLAFKPECGSCLVFNHCITHDGGILKSGEKYILRTEVMYRHHRK